MTGVQFHFDKKLKRGQSDLHKRESALKTIRSHSGSNDIYVKDTLTTEQRIKLALKKMPLYKKSL